MLLYDIGCQYKINLHKRCKNLPQDLQLQTDMGDVFASPSDTPPAPSIDVILPVLAWRCTPGSVQDEELIEIPAWCRNIRWEGSRTAVGRPEPGAMQTKEMQPEVHHDALEDKGDHHNYEKNISMGYLLDWCLKLALEEREVQEKAFDAIDVTLKDEL